MSSEKGLSIYGSTQKTAGKFRFWMILDDFGIFGEVRRCTKYTAYEPNVLKKSSSCSVWRTSILITATWTGIEELRVLQTLPRSSWFQCPTLMICWAVNGRPSFCFPFSQLFKCWFHDPHKTSKNNKNHSHSLFKRIETWWRCSPAVVQLLVISIPQRLTIFKSPVLLMHWAPGAHHHGSC